jgi:hypothetical protein
LIGRYQEVLQKKLWKSIETSKTKKEKEVENKCVKSNAQTPMHFTVVVSFPTICRSHNLNSVGCVEAVTSILVIQ